MCKFRSLTLKVTIATILLFLSSCVYEDGDKTVLAVQKQFRSSSEAVQKQCSAQTCSFELLEQLVRTYHNALGKEKHSVIKSTPLSKITPDSTNLPKNDFDTGNTTNTLKWKIPTGSRFASNEEVSGASLPTCEDNACTEGANPTGVFFTQSGKQIVDVTGSILLPDGRTISADNLAPVVIDVDPFPSQVTYKLPTGTTKTATQVAGEFASFTGKKVDVASVIGNNSNNTLTFTCTTDYYVDPIAVDLADGSDQRGWGQISSSRQGGIVVYDSEDERWENLNFFNAVNNYTLGQGYITGIGCGTPI